MKILIRCCLASLVAGPAVLAAPKITCEVPLFEFGEKPNNTKVEQTYVICNKGDAPLIVDRVQPSCGCTIAEISEKTIAPGACSNIKAVLDLNGRRGPQHKVLTVFSNDPVNREFRLTLSGTATVEVAVTPSYLFLPSVPFGQISTGKVTVVASGTNVVHVTSAISSSPMAKVEVKKLDEGKHTDVEVSMTVPEGSPANAYSRITLKTDNARFPTLAFDVTMAVIEKISVVPNAMAFSIMTGTNSPPNRPVTRYLMIRPGTVKDFKVTEAVWPEENVPGKITSLDKQGYRIQFDNVLPKVELNGKDIVIKTDVPGKETIRIPVSVTTFGAPLTSQNRLAVPLPPNTKPVTVPIPARVLEAPAPK